MTWQLRSGTAQTAIRQTTSWPVLKSSAVRPCLIDFNDVNYFPEDSSVGLGSILEEGDILVTRLSGSVEYVGSCAVVQHLPTSDIRYPDRIFCGKLAGETNASFIAHCFEHPRLRAAIERAAKSTAGHQRISLSDLSAWMLPLPPVAEQEAIVELVEDQLSVIDHLEADLDVKLKNAQALRQSILRHAFTGKLVPQNPNDEPASELLKRIAAERAVRAVAPEAPKQSRTRKSRKTSSRTPVSVRP